MLPKVIEEIIRVIGHGKAMELVREFSGQEMRIPRTESSDTWAALVEVIGERATRALSDAFAGSEAIYIAQCTAAIKAERNRKMIARYDALLKSGHSGRGAVSVLVSEFKPISNRWVEVVVNRPAPTPTGHEAQGELF
ncbi:MAG: hypothetical protein RIR18_425 [Pseudomonadota bacterium]|jgi:hypothetical protein